MLPRMIRKNLKSVTQPGEAKETWTKIKET